jgi:hypothetical protein
MAKKQPESGAGTGMIIALVFFVLTTVILGVTTYLGFDGQTELETKAKAAAADKAKLETRVNEETSRRNMLRILAGTDDESDRTELSGAARANKDAILDEHKRIKDRLGTAQFPPGTNWKWDLIDSLAKGDGPSGPAPAPNKTLPQIAKTWEGLYWDAERRVAAEKAGRAKAEADKMAADKRAEDQKAEFDRQVADLGKRMTDKIAEMDKKFLALKDAADKAGEDFKKNADLWASVKVSLEDEINKHKAQIRVEQDKLRRALTADASDILARLNRLDPIALAQSMGEIKNKSGQFVTIEFSKRIALLPGQSFVVISPGTSLGEVLEREKELEKRHHEVQSLDMREPFSGNERVKGMVEITRVDGPSSAQARVTYQSQAVRDPVGRRDQVFNVSLSSGARERIAFVGIIDLDGDGRPDTDAFMRIMEKNNMKVDAYLDLKTGEVKGRLDYSTKLLILATGAPLVGEVKKMVDRAKELNVPIVDSRRFLTLIGVRSPENPAPPEYTRVTLGGEGSKNVDPEAPAPPVADPKKDDK